MLSQNSKNILFVVIIILIFSIYDSFTNTYIVLRENYETRMIKNAGYCRAHGYGFHQKILNKYYLKDKNIISINFKDFPSPEGYFFSYQNDNLNDALILIGAEEEIVQRYLKEKYKIVYSEKDCYFIRK